MNYQDIGKRIRQRRSELNLTQQQLADKLQVTNKAISKWETGEGYPDISILNELSDALSITVDELLGAGTQKKPEAKSIDLNQTYRKILIYAIPLLYFLPMAQKLFLNYGAPSYTASQSQQLNGIQIISGSPYYFLPQLGYLGLLVIFLWALTHTIAFGAKYFRNIDLFPSLSKTRVRYLNVLILTVSLIIPLYLAAMSGIEIGMILLTLTVITYITLELKALKS